jgi:osmotically-inducible protein OsmY
VAIDLYQSSKPARNNNQQIAISLWLNFWSHQLMSFKFKFPQMCLIVLVGIFISGCSKSEQKPPLSIPSSSVSVNVSDRDVNEHVKTALDQNDSLRRFDIQVITLKGDVRLVGSVETQEQIDEAQSIARAAEGTHSIHNELTIQK